MKKLGAICDYIEDRNRELLSAYHKVVAGVNYIHRDKVLRLVAASPTSRLWISETRAIEVIRKYLLTGRVPNNSRRGKLYAELCRRYDEVVASHTNEDIDSIVFGIVNSPASEFFMTPQSVKVILCKYKKQLRRRS